MQKPTAIISTLLDRQTSLLDSALRYIKFDIISPELFVSTNKAIAKKHDVNCLCIEASADEARDQVEADIHEFKQKLSDGEENLSKWLEAHHHPAALAAPIIRKAQRNTKKLVRLIAGLNRLNERYTIKAVLVNQEYMINETTIIQWAKDHNIPVIHYSHGALMVKNLGPVRHYQADYLTLASERCAEVLDDMNTGRGERHVTGIMNWDIYRDITVDSVEALRQELKIPENSLIVTLFTTFPVVETATADLEVHNKIINTFIEAASNIKKTVDKPLFFIIKDRPSGAHFTEEQVRHKAERKGLNDQFAYIFERAERVVLLSDIVVSCSSSVAIESMAMGKTAIEVVTRPVFLSGLAFKANDGVIQCEMNTLEQELITMIEHDEQREKQTVQGSQNEKYVGGLKRLTATQESASLLLKILGESDKAEQIAADDEFYEKLSIVTSDHRFHQVDNFQTWRSRTQVDGFSGQLMGERYNQWRYKPSFHLVMVVDQSLFHALAATLDSLAQQIYPHYGVSILSPSDCPDAELQQSNNMQWIKTDSPFETINQVIEAVDADWVMQLTPGDDLQPQALFNIADYADLYPDWLAIYGDEALLKRNEDDFEDHESRFDDSLQTNALFKPDFNLDLLRSTDYVNRSVAFKKEAWRALDGFQPVAYRQNEDLIFRLAEKMVTPAIGHIPQILIYRSESVNQLTQSDRYETLGGYIREQHLKRCGFDSARVLPGLYKGIYNTHYYPDALEPNADLLIVHSKLDDTLSGCLLSLQEQGPKAWPNKIILGVPETTESVQSWLEIKNLTTLSVHIHVLDSWQGELHAWRQMLKASDSEYFILAVAHLRWVQEGWMKPLLDQLTRPDIAMSAPRLVSTRASIISAGQILGKDGLLGDLYRHFFLEQDIKGLPRAWCEQNFNALNPACIAIKKSALNLTNGLDSTYKSQLGINDAQLQLCLKGYKLVWTPLSTLVCINDNPYIRNAPTEEIEQFKDQWFNLLCQDPAFNYNLELRNSGIEADILLSGQWHPAYKLRPRLLLMQLNAKEDQIKEFSHFATTIKKASTDEIIQSQTHIYNSLSNIEPVNALEITRLNPDLCLYIGSPNKYKKIIEDLSHYSQVQQWLIIQNQYEHDEWSEQYHNFTGVLIMGDQLSQHIDTQTPKFVIHDTEHPQEEIQDWLKNHLLT